MFRRLPGIVIGLLFAALALGVHMLLSGGPRANIYFQF
jgi:tetrahydromethanopterin S-methyltransferase subunit F